MKSVKSESGRYATKEEIIGHWKLVEWNDAMKKRMNVAEPWPLKYQWFGIYANGDIFTYMTNDSVKVTASDIDEMYKLLKPTMKYIFKNGFLKVKHSASKGSNEKWGVNYITKTLPAIGTEFKPGDLLMSLDDGNGNVVYYRHLRKLN